MNGSLIKENMIVLEQTNCNMHAPEDVVGQKVIFTSTKQPNQKQSRFIHNTTNLPIKGKDIKDANAMSKLAQMENHLNVPTLNN